MQETCTHAGKKESHMKHWCWFWPLKVSSLYSFETQTVRFIQKTKMNRTKVSEDLGEEQRLIFSNFPDRLDFWSPDRRITCSITSMSRVCVCGLNSLSSLWVMHYKWIWECSHLSSNSTLSLTSVGRLHNSKDYQWLHCPQPKTPKCAHTQFRRACGKTSW